jgi:predicted permease
LKENIDYQRAYRIDLLAAGHGVSELRKQFSHAAVVLMGAVGLLLLAVCANVAGLLLARSEERHGEIAIRLSLGAGRGRILRQFALENVLLAIPGALLGLAFAYGSSPWLLRLLPALGIGPYAPPVVLDVRPDGRVLLFVLVTCFLTIVLFGLAPVRRVLKVDLNERLKAQSRTVTAGSGNTIAAIQTALAVLLLTGATLMYRTFWNLEHVNPGFDRAHVVEFTIDPWDVGYSETQAATLIRELNGRVRALPGVRAVSFAVGEMMRGIGMKSTVVPAGQMLPANTFLNTSFNRVTSGYFESLGIPLVAGRALSAGDAGRKPTPIVVNRAFAAAFFPGINPIGQMIVAGVDGRKAPTAIIVGVVGTAKYRSLREQDPPIYYAAADEEHAGGTMYVRSYGDPAGLIRSVRRVLSRLAPGLPLVHALTLEQDVQDSLWQERFLTVLGAFFGLAALSLSAIGLYGNLAYSVARRSKELGIRIALGAQVRDIVRSVSGRIVWAIAIGLLAGAGAATFLLRFAGGLVFGIDPLDPVSFAAAAMVLIVCSVIAAIPPSWRAVQTDAAVALRQE